MEGGQSSRRRRERFTGADPARCSRDQARLIYCHLTAALTAFESIFGVLFRRLHTNIGRTRWIWLQHPVPGCATNRARFGFQGNLCPTTCTKSGHVTNLHSCYGTLDERRNGKDSR
jgi:hypothetical protein